MAISDMLLLAPCGCGSIVLLTQQQRHRPSHVDDEGWSWLCGSRVAVSVGHRY